MRSLSAALMSAGLPEAIPRLLQADGKKIGPNALLAANLVGLTSRAHSVPTAVPLVRYMEAGGAHVDKAIIVLVSIYVQHSDSSKGFVKATLGKEPHKLAENMSPLMVKGTQMECLPAYTLLQEYLKFGDTETLLRAAVAGVLSAESSGCAGTERTLAPTAPPLSGRAWPC